MKTRNILSKKTVKLTLITSCAVLLVGLGAFSALDAKATEGKNDKLNIEKATSIALEDANYKSSDVEMIRGSSDIDDGKTKYEIKFNADGKEYEYEINAKTGEIIDKSVEQVDAKKPVANDTTNEKPAATTPAQSEPAAETLTADEAKAIALRDANLTDATFVKIELDREDGVTFYEIEFRSNGYEYEYEVSATTGKVLDKSVDRDDD